MDNVFVTFSGTNLASGLIAREVSLYFPSTESWRHCFIDTPGGMKFTPGDWKTDRYTRRFLGGMSLNTALHGSLQLRDIRNMLLKISLTHKLYCIGSVDRIFLENMMPYAWIEDVQDIVDFKYPKALPSANCGFSHNDVFRYCSLAKLQYVVRNIDPTLLN